MPTFTHETMTTPELAEMIGGFAGVRLNPVRDARGFYLPRTVAIDILAGSERFDADVREVGPEGVKVFRSHDLDLLPWSDIRAIRIAALDKDGNRTASRRIAHERMVRRLAA